MLHKPRGLAIEFGPIEKELSMEPALHLKNHGGTWDKWRETVDKKILELTERVILVEEQNQILKRLLAKFGLINCKVMKEDMLNMHDQNKLNSDPVKHETPSISMFSELSLEGIPQNKAGLEIKTPCNSCIEQDFPKNEDLHNEKGYVYGKYRQLSVRSVDGDAFDVSVFPHKKSVGKHKRHMSDPGVLSSITSPTEVQNSVSETRIIPSSSDFGMPHVEKEAFKLTAPPMNVSRIRKDMVPEDTESVKWTQERSRLLKQSRLSGTRNSWKKPKQEDSEKRRALRELLQMTLNSSTGKKKASQDPHQDCISKDELERDFYMNLQSV